MRDTTDVAIYVDPACPWAWLTSRWLAEVEQVRPIRVTTKLFSLAEANRDREANERQAGSHRAAEFALRILVAARREGGDQALARLYTEIGEAHQERGEPLDDEATLERCALAAGLESAIVARALADSTTHDDLLAEHAAAVALGAFGVPALTLDGGWATFGPCIDVRIQGEEAGELWDRVAWLLGAEHFFELKRNRGRASVGRYAALAAS